MVQALLPLLPRQLTAAAAAAAVLQAQWRGYTYTFRQACVVHCFHALVRAQVLIPG